MSKKNEKITPEQLVREYLPNYDERYKEYYLSDVDDSSSPYFGVDFHQWIEDNFAEALEEFARAQHIEL